MNARQVLQWVRANVFIVVFTVIMLAAIVALPLVAARMNAGVQETVQQRLADKRALEQLERTSVEIPQPGGRPPESRNALVNEQTLNRYREVVEREKEDAERILDRALAFNRKGRGVVMPEALPTSALDRTVLGQRWHEAIREAWRTLFEEVRAGRPADPADVAEQLRRRERLFLTQTLQKDPQEPLTAEEQERLAEHLADARMGIYAERASDIGFYLDDAARNVPVYDIRTTYTLEALFDQQWDYWITEDILRAIADLNEGTSVRVAPLKRVTALVIDPAGPPSAGGPAPGGRRGGAAGGGGAVAPMPMDPRSEARLDYQRSVTGRATNGLYDVRTLTLEVVMATERIPALVDALGSRNFITVLDMTVQPDDAFAAARRGYFYGDEPVSRVRMRVETVWLREWTSRFMPAGTKAALGVPVAPPAAAGGQG